MIRLFIICLLRGLIYFNILLIFAIITINDSIIYYRCAGKTATGPGTKTDRKIRNKQTKMQKEITTMFYNYLIAAKIKNI